MPGEDLSKLRIDKTFVRGSLTRKKRWIYSSLLLFFIAIVLVSYWSGLLAPTTTVRVYSVQNIYPSQTFTLLNASGYVVAQRKAALAAKITGRLVHLEVEEGSSVQKGQVVAHLENDDALAALDLAKAELELARIALEERNVELKNALQELERKKRVVERGYVSGLEYDAAVARHERARVAVLVQNAAIRSGEAAVRAARVNADYAYITAPFDGVVLTKNADMGDIVTPLGAAANAKAAVVTIADMDSLQVETDVSESSIGQVAVGQPCLIQLDALPQERFEGRVHMIVPTADRSKASVMVKVSFDRMDSRVLPEMGAKVSFLSREIEPHELEPVLAVLSSALVSRQGKDVVYVVEGGVARETPIQRGRAFGDLVEVLEGLTAGDRVVLSPHELRHMARVKIEE